MWTTSKGEEKPIPSLADDHLLNIIAMLERKAQNYKMFLTEKYRYKNEPQAIEILNTITASDVAEEYFPPYNELKQEAEHRHLLKGNQHV